VSVRMLHITTSTHVCRGCACIHVCVVRERVCMFVGVCAYVATSPSLHKCARAADVYVREKQKVCVC